MISIVRRTAETFSSDTAAQYLLDRVGLRLEPIGVDAHGVSQCARLHRPRECVGNTGRTQRHEHAVIEHAEDAFEDANGWRSHARLHVTDEELAAEGTTDERA